MMILSGPLKTGDAEQKSLRYYRQKAGSGFSRKICVCVFVYYMLNMFLYACGYTCMCVNVCEGQGSMGAFLIFLRRSLLLSLESTLVRLS